MSNQSDSKKKKKKEEKGAKPGDYVVHDPGGWGTFDMTPKKKKKSK